jgi:hypothetical protein
MGCPASTEPRIENMTRRRVMLASAVAWYSLSCQCRNQAPDDRATACARPPMRRTTTREGRSWDLAPAVPRPLLLLRSTPLIQRGVLQPQPVRIRSSGALANSLTRAAPMARPSTRYFASTRGPWDVWPPRHSGRGFLSCPAPHRHIGIGRAGGFCYRYGPALDSALTPSLTKSSAMPPWLTSNRSLIP